MRRAAGAGLAIVAVLGAGLWAARRRDAARPSSSGPEPARMGIGCLGRIEPEAGVIRVSAPYFNGHPSLMAELRVHEDDWARAGQVLAVLQSEPQLRAAHEQSRARESVARGRLANAEAELGRYTKLYETRDVSSSELDAKRLAAETARAELTAAAADAVRAEAEWRTSLVRAPSPGRILKVHARPGEEIGPEGLLELGDTTRMAVIAEVYETDVARVHPGQKAVIAGEILPASVSGTVKSVGSLVAKHSVLPTDPTAFSDARVVKVEILADEPRKLAGLVYGKVSVVIQP